MKKRKNCCVCFRKMPEKLRSRCGFFGDHGFDNKITSMRVKSRLKRHCSMSCCLEPDLPCHGPDQVFLPLLPLPLHRPSSWAMDPASSSRNTCRSLRILSSTMSCVVRVWLVFYSCSRRDLHETRVTKTPEQHVFLPLSPSDLLGLTPAPNNGTYGSLNDMLRQPQFFPAMPEEVTSPEAACSSCDAAATTSQDLGCSCDDEVGVRSPRLGHQLGSTEAQKDLTPASCCVSCLL